MSHPVISLVLLRSDCPDIALMYCAAVVTSLLLYLLRYKASCLCKHRCCCHRKSHSGEEHFAQLRSYQSTAFCNTQCNESEFTCNKNDRNVSGVKKYYQKIGDRCRQRVWGMAKKKKYWGGNDEGSSPENEYQTRCRAGNCQMYK